MWERQKLYFRGQEDSLIQLKIKELEQLVQKGKITNLDIEQTPSITPKGWEKFYQASPEDQKEALERYEAIKPYLEGKKPEIETRSPRTIRERMRKISEGTTDRGVWLFRIIVSP